MDRLFKTPDPAALHKRLERPAGPVDAVLDTDTYNEVDDQFALSYFVKSEDRIRPLAVTAAPFSQDPKISRIVRAEDPGDGMEKSYREIKKVLKLAGREDLCNAVYRGSTRYLPDEQTPVESEAARKIAELAMEHTGEKPLYVVAIGAITNVASALLMEPAIAERIVIVWLGGHAQHYGGCEEFNMRQDIAGARVVFSSGAAVVQLPCMGVVSEFRFSRPELEYWFRDKNPLCNYLIDAVYEYAKDKFDYQEWSKPLWDVTAVAWLMGKDWLMEREIPSPIPQYDLCYGFDPNRHPVKYVYYVKKDPIIKDLAEKLTKQTAPLPCETA